MTNREGNEMLSSTGTVLFTIFFLFSHQVFSQTNENAGSISQFNGDVTVTSNGISTIPNLTLGEPAAIFDLSLGKGKLSFEPTLRFSMEGQPWSFIFWWRYNLINIDKFKMNVGAHPAISFKPISIAKEEFPDKVTRARRFLAVEAAPNYFLTENISLGLYYLYARALEKDIVKNTHFIAFTPNFSNITLSDQFYMGFTPQVYYLKRGKDGFYFNSTLTLASRDCPVSLSAIFNITIDSNIPASHDYLWSISLTYSFNNKYIKTK